MPGYQLLSCACEDGDLTNFRWLDDWRGKTLMEHCRPRRFANYAGNGRQCGAWPTSENVDHCGNTVEYQNMIYTCCMNTSVDCVVQQYIMWHRAWVLNIHIYIYTHKMCCLSGEGFHGWRKWITQLLDTWYMIYMDEDEMNGLPLPFCGSHGLEGSRDSEVVLQILQDVYFMYICTVCFTHN